VHLLRAAPLAVKLRERLLSEPEKFSYALAAGVLQFVVGGRSLIAGPWSWESVAATLIGIGVFVLGLLQVFRVNQRGDGQAFLERYLCLSVPVLCQVYLIGYGLWFGVAVALAAMRVTEPPGFLLDPTGVRLVYGYAMLVAYLVLLRRHMARAAVAKRAA
jgi:hypothetical protein